MKYFLVFMLMGALSAGAQQWDDFSDEDLGKDPEWTGEISKFKFSSSSAVPEAQRPALQLNGSGADSAWISLRQGSFPAMQWEFWIKLSFNSSASNFARIYLGSDTADPAGAGEACYLQIGGADDSVWFARKDTSGTTSLYHLPLLFTGNSTNALRMKVIRNADGKWQFSGDPSGGDALMDLGESEIPGSAPGPYFGLSCHYTSSNASKMYFDDIYCGPEIVDSIPPEILRAKVISKNMIRLSFSEAIEQNTASDISNYQLSGGAGKPIMAELQQDPAVILLFFEDNFTEGTNYTLNIYNLQDISGNVMAEYSTDLVYYLPKPYDVLVNEIMADPSPATGLPEFEYLELFNRTAFLIDLTGWELLIGTGSHTFTECYIQPLGYLVVVDEDYIPGYTQFGKVAGLPSFSISNEGAAITLLDTSGTLICHTQYDPGKFDDPKKAEGGWALERTDPGHPCLDDLAWAASIDPSGGTPDRENSIVENIQTPVQIEYACCTGPSSVMLKFNQGMDQAGQQDIGNYSADHGLGQPVSAVTADPAGREVLLTFSGLILPGVVYRLDVRSDLKDCEGNAGEFSLAGSFSQPSACDPFDLIFNEILFNPLAAGAEYLELYNRSGKTIHLDELQLAQIREVPPNPPDTDYYTISEGCRPLYPGEFALLTKYPEKVAEQYFTESPGSFLKMDPFPVFSNEGGKLRLTDLSHVTIDGLDYEESMQYPLLTTFSGISLERISPDVIGMEPGNWHSASSACGYGTPGYLNSQYQESNPSESVLEIDPVAFTPNGDGRDDVLGVLSRFDEPGMLVTVIIFNENGQLVRRLVEGFLAGAENRFSWDGLTDGGRRAPEGVYVVFMEALSLDGYTRTFKKAAVLAFSN